MAPQARSGQVFDQTSMVPWSVGIMLVWERLKTRSIAEQRQFRRREFLVKLLRYGQ